MSKHKSAAASKRVRRPKMAAKAQRARQAIVRGPRSSTLRVSTESLAELLPVMRTPVALPPPRTGSSAMQQQRRRFKQIETLEQRLAIVVLRLRKLAQGTPAGIKRERLIRRAQQAEAAAHMNEMNG